MTSFSQIVARLSPTCLTVAMFGLVIGFAAVGVSA